MSRDIKRVGTRALMIDLDSLEEVMDFYGALNTSPLERQTDVVAGARTVLVTFDSTSAAKEAAEFLRTFTPEAAAAKESREIEIEVCYDGEDLDELAQLLGKTREELIEWHTSTVWKAGFGGFAPGFTYCVPADEADALDVPRRSSPRTEVPAGAVALAGDFSAVYPRTSPGGWQLIGTTTTPMWDSTAEPPALVSPGDTVRYVRVDKLTDEQETSHYELDTPPRMPLFTVDEAGLQTLYQDLGRQGNGSLGVTTSGSSDRASARIANDVVGNKRNATLLENIGGLSMTALAETVVCVTGADSDVFVGQKPFPLATPIIVPAGAQLVVSPPRTGMRSYIAVRGGLIADTELDSAATDLLSGLGPAPIQAGDTVSVSMRKPGTATDLLSNPLRVTDDVATVRCVLGPRDDWFNKAEVERFLDTTFTVTGESNRVGVRLETDEPLQRERGGELPSEGMVAGSVQVPPSGQPVVFLRDHAVTGGYPVIATVISEDVDIAAQLSPGSTIRFELYSEGE